MTCHPLSANVVRSGNQLQKHPKKQAHSKASTRCRCLWWRPWCWCCPFPGKVLVRKIADQFVGRLDTFTVHSVITSQCRNVIQCHTMSRNVKNLSKLSEFLWPLLHWACVIFTSFFSSASLCPGKQDAAEVGEQQGR